MSDLTNYDISSELRCSLVPNFDFDLDFLFSTEETIISKKNSIALKLLII